MSNVLPKKILFSSDQIIYITDSLYQNKVDSLKKKKFEDNSHLKEDYNDNLLCDNYIEKKDEETNLKDSENNNDHQFLDIQSLSSDILNNPKV